MKENENFTPAPWKCPVCGSTYRKKETQKYCSHRCMWTMNGKSQEKREHWWKNEKGYIEGVCLVDGVWKRKKKHRRIIELVIGRELLPTEDVHHINGDKSDNRIENLKLLSHSAYSNKTNSEREYKRGYKLNISQKERDRRSQWMKSVHLKKARGEE